jgi:hypothetical protein
VEIAPERLVAGRREGADEEADEGAPVPDEQTLAVRPS